MTQDTTGREDGMRHLIATQDKRLRALEAIIRGDFTSYQRLTLYYLITIAGALDREAPAHVYEMIKHLDQGERVQRAALHSLTERGVISTQHRSGRTSLYRVHSDKLLAISQEQG